MSVLRVGIPTNEKVLGAVEALLENTGCEVKRSPKHFFTDQDYAYQTGVQLVFARTSELARLVAIGRLDSAFVTKDWWEDCKDGFYAWRYFYEKTATKIIAEFPAYCRCEIAFITQGHYRASGVAESGIASYLAAFVAIQKRQPLIATRFPRLTDKFLKSKGLDSLFYKKYGGEAWDMTMSHEIAFVNGSEELYTLLGAADVAVAQIETGETIANHSLHVIERILTSHLVLVGNDHRDLPIFALNVLSSAQNLH